MGVERNTMRMPGICISCLQVGKFSIPSGKGGSFDFFPHSFAREGIDSILNNGEPYVFYIYCWQSVYSQPHIGGMKVTICFGEHVSLDQGEGRFGDFVNAFRWRLVLNLIDVTQTDLAPTSLSSHKSIGPLRIKETPKASDQHQIGSRFIK